MHALIGQNAYFLWVKLYMHCLPGGGTQPYFG